MKPKEFIKKYHLNESVHFNHQNFITDLAFDFRNLVEFQSQSNWSFAKFQNCITEIKQKFDSISNKAIEPLNEKLWNYFYATVVVPVKEEQFGEALRKKKEEREREKHEHYSWSHPFETYQKNQRGSASDFWSAFIFNEFFNQFFKEKLNNIFQETDKTVLAFKKLNLPQTATKEEIQSKFRKLCLTEHPDKGGSNEKFREIIEAKNFCMMYAQV